MTASIMKKDSNRNLTAFTLRMIGDIWTALAAPPLLLGLLGNRLDAAIGSRPYVFVSCLFLAFVISTVSVCTKAVKYGEQYELLTDTPPPLADAAATSRGDPPEKPEGGS